MEELSIDDFLANSWIGHHAVSVWIFIKGVKGISFSRGISLSYTGKLIAGDLGNGQSSDRFIITVSAMCGKLSLKVTQASSREMLI